MDFADDFSRYARLAHGVSSTTQQKYARITSGYINPSIIEERHLNAVTMDVFSRLMMDRIIFLGVAIDDDVANIIQAQLLFLESTDPGKDITIYINSPGGSVFASSTIVSLLKRFKQEHGIKIHSYIDGLCASAATYICMVADDINVYQNSIMMIHKPLSFAYGNSDDFQKEIDTLNTIENNMMIPMYMNKFKKSEEELRNLIKDETWFNGNIFDKYYIGEFFNINYIDETKQAVALKDSNLLKNYANKIIFGSR